MFKPSLGVFADNIDLYRFVNTQNKNSYSYGRLSHIYNKDTPFCCNGYNTYKLFYRLENPDIGNFLPYTYKDREDLRNRWYKAKNKFNTQEFCILTLASGDNPDSLIINNIDAQEFLLNYEWLDGSPCGILKS